MHCGGVLIEGNTVTPERLKYDTDCGVCRNLQRALRAALKAWPRTSRTRCIAPGRCALCLVKGHGEREGWRTAGVKGIVRNGWAFREEGRSKGKDVTNEEISISKKAAKIKNVGNQRGNSVRARDDWFVSHSQHCGCILTPSDGSFEFHSIYFDPSSVSPRNGVAEIVFQGDRTLILQGQCGSIHLARHHSSWGCR